MDQFAKETLPISLEDEMRRSYLDYAMSVIVGRALPDARDGLKPVHRRVLYAMHELSNDWNKAYKKSARIVGDVIGKYHPHGDTAVYDTIVRMAQDFSLRYMLVDGQGNFGSVDGDNAAAMRYTEVRMARIGHQLLEDLDKETVDFGPNYDGSESEPLVMPARIPNLLINGSSGIAVGIATNIPPHNLNEVIAGCLALLANPAIGIEELIEHVPAPDFPTAALIYGVMGVREGYKTGRGRVVMRARTHFEESLQRHVSAGLPQGVGQELAGLDADLQPVREDLEKMMGLGHGPCGGLVRSILNQIPLRAQAFSPVRALGRPALPPDEIGREPGPEQGQAGRDQRAGRGRFRGQVKGQPDRLRAHFGHLARGQGKPGERYLSH